MFTALLLSTAFLFAEGKPLNDVQVVVEMRQQSDKDLDAVRKLLIDAFKADGLSETKAEEKANAIVVAHWQEIKWNLSHSKLSENDKKEVRRQMVKDVPERVYKSTQNSDVVLPYPKNRDVMALALRGFIVHENKGYQRSPKGLPTIFSEERASWRQNFHSNVVQNAQVDENGRRIDNAYVEEVRQELGVKPYQRHKTQEVNHKAQWRNIEDK